MRLLLLALAGALGTLCRHGMNQAIQSGPGKATPFPLGTFAVNVAGCFLAGLLASSAGRSWLRPEAREILAVGFCGGFTTFSSFGLQAAVLGRSGEGWMAVSYVLASNVAGIAAVLSGFAVGGVRE